jgi:3-dehydroquinate synthase
MADIASFKMSKSKQIQSSIHDYEIFFENNLDFFSHLLAISEAVFIIDKNVFELYHNLFKQLDGQDKLIILDAIEENKTLAASEKIFDKVIALKPTKKTKIVSLGGGITQDVSGFVASTFYRGLNWIYVPTTLLAQADSCMGSKTSLNFKSYKNILGTFYPPHEIYICPEFTNTLSEEDFYSGMGEVVKLHAMGGSENLEKLQKTLNKLHNRDINTILESIQSSLEIKWTYMDGDEFDQGKRNLLNYGHEFGHAIETATNYKIPHGQAVIIGMIMANFVSNQRKILDEKLMKSIEVTCLELLKCNFKIISSISKYEIISSMKQDKKRVGDKLPLIVLDNMFLFSKILDLTEYEAISAIEYFQKEYCN